jgi:hypothetical protein
MGVRIFFSPTFLFFLHPLFHGFVLFSVSFVPLPLFCADTGRLHDEILDFCDYMSPSPVEEHMRDALIERTKGLVKSIWPQAEFHIFGSYATGIYLPTRLTFF